MINRRIKLLAFTLMCLVVLNFNITEAKPHDKEDGDDDFNDDSDFSVKFLNAWYTDLEGDGFEDDIVLKIKIKYEDIEIDDDNNGVDRIKGKTTVKNNNKQLKLKIELVLPSGFSFLHYVEKSINSEEVILDILLYNHAVESGWYWGHITIVDNYHNPLSKKDSIFFDPPGGRSGGTVRVL
ncbi:MAG: hypothetical protein GPJ54_10685 [Candidatus Heimdallarchaeota archaeon]|nr:hypothetical protein [Candidatus Heimdallarchaeota archaeon]